METYYRVEDFQDPHWFRVTALNAQLTLEQATQQHERLKKENPTGVYRVVLDQ